MAFKAPFMWELVVVSLGKHCMVMDLHLCLPSQNLRFVRGVAVAVPRRRLKEVRGKSTGTLGEKTLSLLFSIFGKLTVSARNWWARGSDLRDSMFIVVSLFLQTTMSMRGPCLSLR